ncbi:MAG: GntR family transcriptional regulator [Candidatus Hydrogenedentes bacterium]|nr:GntR family transcriptional regulator [Candidatus Hydrogenedentota bacterium]
MKRRLSQTYGGGETPLLPSVPIYEQLVAFYRQAILSNRLVPGDRVDSITQIQRRHRVSRETAKRVLNQLESEGYIIQRAGKGSFVANLGPKLRRWGMVLPFFSVQYEDLVARISHLAASAGREVVRYFDYNNWEEEIRLVQMMQEDRYEAVVIVPTLDESRTWEFYAGLPPKGCRLMLLDHTMSYRDFNFVIQSYDLGVVRAMEHLLSRGAGGVAFVANEGWTGRNMVLELMTETYRMALLGKRPGYDPVILERATLVDGASLRSRGVTGIVCCDDVSAIRAVGRLREQGVAIPGEMGVVSYGNTDLARYFTPALTSVDPHNEEMARQVASFLSSESRAELIQYVVQPELVVRET